MRYNFARTVRHTVLTLLALLLLGCGQPAPISEQPSSLSLDEALAQVQAVDLSGLDPQTQAQLRESFSNMLIASGKTRFVSLVVGVGVSDLAVTDNGNGTASFHWTYLNPGDFDQNSQVNVADLTPLGAHLNDSTTDGFIDHSDLVTDGDQNGEVNIAELTVLGKNLLHTVNAYHLEVSTDSGANWNNVVDVPFADSEIPIYDPGPPKDYGFRYYDQQISNPVDGAWYRVVSVGAGMDGGASNIVTFTTGGGPGQIQNLAATQGTVANQVDLTWDAHPDATSGYDVLRADTQGGTYNVIDSIVPNTYSDTTALPGVHYWYKVQGEDGTGSPFGQSSAVEGWAQNPAPPAAPANFTASDGDFSDHIALSWDPVAEAVLYHIWRSAFSGGGHVEIGTTVATLYDDTAPLPSTGYYYVTAEDGFGQLSGASNEDSGFTSLPGSPQLTLDAPPQGSGTAGDPYIVAPLTSWAFTLTDPIDGNVTATGSYTTSDIAEVYVQGSFLHVDDMPAPDFTFQGNYKGQDSNTIYFHLGGPPPSLTLDSPPALGNGTQADPYIVPAGSQWDFTLFDTNDGDVTDQGASYTTSDPEISTSGRTLQVGSNPPADFNFYGSYLGQDSNRIYFHLDSGAPFIAPWSIDVNWLGIPNWGEPGAGTNTNPYILHDSNFNQDNDLDGICDTPFTFMVNGDQGDNENFDWYCTDPTLVADINNPGTKGTFHVADPPDNNVHPGQLYASDGVNESNHIYFEIWP